MKNTGMKSNRSRFAMIAMGLLCVALLFMMFPGDLSAQDFLPRFDRFRVIQTDTTHINFREIWLKSKDVNKDNAPGFTKRAFEKIEKGFFAEALADLERSVKLDSMIAGNYTLLGFLKFKQDSITQAMMYFKKALSINSSDPANYFCLGDVYMKLNKLEAADSCYKICTTLDGEYYQAYFKRANIAFAGNDIKTAETLYRKVIEVNPGYGMAYFNLALVFLYTNPDKTIRYLNKAVAHDPGFAGAWFFRGYLNLLMNGSKRAALDDWGRAIELEPANVTYHMFRGFFNIHMEKYQEGVNEIVHTLNARGYHAGISDYEESPLTQRIVDFFSQLEQVGRDSVFLAPGERAKIREALGSFYNKDHDRAYKVYRKLLPVSSRKGLICYLTGYNLEYMKDAAGAAGYYQKAAANDPYPVESLLREGYCLMSLEKYPEAIGILTSYIRSRDSVKFAYRCRGISRVKVMQYDSAILDFTRFIRLDSTVADIWFNRAICYKELGGYPEAVRDFSHIGKHIHALDAESAELLAECTYLTGDTAGALKILTCGHQDEKGTVAAVSLKFDGGGSGKVIVTTDYLVPAGHLLRGIIYLDYARYDSAILDFNWYINYNKTNELAYMYKGKAHFGSHDYDSAVIDFTAAIALDEHDMNAWYNRGLAWFRLKKPEKSYADFKVALSLGHTLAAKFIETYLKDYKHD